MQQRRLGRLGHDSSVLIYGAAALGGVTQDEADRSIQQALDAGINHFDVAASYGDAELRLGPWMDRIRADIFLSTKTELRDYDASWGQINASLERLQTDKVDLIQLHAIGDLEDLDRATGDNGSLKAAIRARDEGMAAAIGITGHGNDAPATHLEGLRRFPFDSVLTPWNWVLGEDPLFRADYEALAAEAGRQDVGFMTIKTASRRNWPKGAEERYTTWYEPFEEQELISAAVAWVLSFPEITGIPTAGDVGLLGMLIEAERTAADTSREEAAAVLRRAANYSSPFIDIPI